eukprot:766768-Hanusia_phi.AAC.3
MLQLPLHRQSCKSRFSSDEGMKLSTRLRQVIESKIWSPGSTTEHATRKKSLETSKKHVGGSSIVPVPFSPSSSSSALPQEQKLPKVAEHGASHPKSGDTLLYRYSALSFSLRPGSASESPPGARPAPGPASRAP